MKRWQALLSFLVTSGLAALPACTDASSGGGNGEDLDGDGKADGNTSVVSTENLNGLWDGTIDDKPVEDVVIRSWDSIGIQIDIGGKTHTLTRKKDKLTASGIDLAIDPKDVGQLDDEINGTVDGVDVALHRDVEIKEPVTIELPKDRPYRMWMQDSLAAASQADRESYTVMDAAKIKEFMQSTVLFQAGSFQRKYMKGANRAEQTQNMLDMIDEIDGIETTPRSIIKDPRFTSAVKNHLKDQSLAGLALVNFNLYFTTGAGRALRMPITADSMAYFITDRPSRAEKLGLVVMDTPSHAPLASTFGRQLLDMREMPAGDTHTYAQAMMELLTKSDPTTAAKLSGVGQSALTDWFAVMAIEDYRVVDFSDPDLGWGYNMTNVQFFGLVARALGGQVIVDNELRPGGPDYADVLNSGNDMQEFDDMAQLKTLATKFLRQKHPDLVTAVESAFAGIVPASELDSRAKADIFHFVCAQLYDNQGRQSKLTGAAADRANAAVVALVDVLTRESADFEAFILASGIKKSSTPAPKSTGF